MASLVGNGKGEPMTTPPAPLPGWYPEPSGGSGLRYWDGREWTAVAPAPPPPAPSATPTGGPIPPPAKRDDGGSNQSAQQPHHSDRRTIAMLLAVVAVGLDCLVPSELRRRQHRTKTHTLMPSSLRNLTCCSLRGPSSKRATQLVNCSARATRKKMRHSSCGSGTPAKARCRRWSATDRCCAQVPLRGRLIAEAIWAMFFTGSWRLHPSRQCGAFS